MDRESCLSLLKGCAGMRAHVSEGQVPHRKWEVSGTVALTRYCIYICPAALQASSHHKSVQRHGNTGTGGDCLHLWAGIKRSRGGAEEDQPSPSGGCTLCLSSPDNLYPEKQFELTLTTAAGPARSVPTTTHHPPPQLCLQGGKAACG